MIAEALAAIPRAVRGHVMGEGEEYDLLTGGASTAAGETVTAETALKVAAVYACTSIIASSVRLMPLRLLRDSGDGVLLPERKHRLWELLHSRPNEEMAAGEVWERAAWWTPLRGNFYAYLERNEAGQVVAIWPLNSGRVSVGRHPQTRRKIYAVTAGTDDDRVRFVGNTEEILHVKGDPGPSSLVGVSVLNRLRETVGRALSEDRHAATTMRNQGRPSGVLKVPGTLTDEAAERLVTRWNAAHGGARKAGRTAVLEEGAEWNSVTLSAADLELVKQRAISREDIAIAFKIPGDMVLAGGSANLHYSSDASRDVRLVKHGVSPWTRRIEESFEASPVFPWGNDLYPRFNPDALLRADIKTRYEAHKAAWEAGWITGNEIRRKEDMAPLGGLDRTKPQLDSQPSQSRNGHSAATLEELNV